MKYDSVLLITERLHNQPTALSALFFKSTVVFTHLFHLSSQKLVLNVICDVKLHKLLTLVGRGMASCNQVFERVKVELLNRETYDNIFLLKYFNNTYTDF